MISKIRFIEPGAPVTFQHSRNSIKNIFTYNRGIVNPGTGLIILTTIAKDIIDDTLMYSEAITEVDFNDIYDADIVFISIFTFNALRGYEIAEKIRRNSKAIIVFGGLHASLHYTETVEYCDYLLTGDGDESIVELIRTLDAGKPVDFPGVIYKKNGKIINTGKRHQPENIDIVPNRNLVYNYAKLVKKYDTLWPQVHASRGCNHNCDYCSVIRHFGRKIRKRSPENVVAEIKDAIQFHKKKFLPKIASTLWLTDDNFAQDREWAMEVLNQIIKNKIKYNFYVQARFEIGFDDQMLDLMKKAGFHDLALGIEFLDDQSFENYHKKSNYDQIVKSIQNIQKHGLGVYGLFIVGADEHKKGIGEKIAKFVNDNKLHGALIQSLFFTPGTPFFEQYKERLIHQNWNYFNGNIVHYPKQLAPHELLEEMIIASKKIYSVKNLVHALFTYKWIAKMIFTGNFFWNINLRKDLRQQMPYLRSLSEGTREKIRIRSLYAKPS